MIIFPAPPLPVDCYEDVHSVSASDNTDPVEYELTGW